MNKTSLSEAYIECRYDEYCHMFYGEFNDEKVCSEFHMCHDAAKIEYMKQSSCGESRLYKKGITDVIGWLENYVACIKRLNIIKNSSRY